jgi:hypothetical protein
VSSAGVADLVIGIAVLALVIYRQLAVRRVRENYRLVLILAVTAGAPGGPRTPVG